MKRVLQVLAAVCLCAWFLAGCGAVELPESIEVTTLVVSEKGEVTSCLVEDFSQDYYDVTELKDMAARDVAAYNEENRADGNPSLALGRVEKVGMSDVLVEHIFRDGTAFGTYTGYEYFYGTVQEALLAGYSLEGSFTAVKDGTLIVSPQVKNPEKTYVLITDFPAVIYAPRKVTHVSAGVVYREDGSVDALSAEGKAFLLMK